MKLLFDKEIYEKFLLEYIPQTKSYLWLVTADLKDLHIKINNRFQPLLAILSQLISKNVEIRLLHAKEPGPRFRNHFDSFPNLITSSNFHRTLCPRQHSKIIIVDGKAAFLGSANLTGAGIGGRSEHKRNFEAGVLIEDTKSIQKLEKYVNNIFLGNECPTCQMYSSCPDPIQ